MPIMTYACGAGPRFSMRTVCSRGATATAGLLGGGAPPCHLASAFSSIASSCCSVTSPTTTSSLTLGLQRVAWKRARSSRRVCFTECSVPIGQWPYG